MRQGGKDDLSIHSWPDRPFQLRESPRRLWITVWISSVENAVEIAIIDPELVRSGELTFDI